MSRPDIVRLEMFAIKLEAASKKPSPILDDMNWLVNELRSAWLKLEKVQVFVDIGDNQGRADDQLILAIRKVVEE